MIEDKVSKYIETLHNNSVTEFVDSNVNLINPNTQINDILRAFAMDINLEYLLVHQDSNQRKLNCIITRADLSKFKAKFAYNFAKNFEPIVQSNQTFIKGLELLQKGNVCVPVVNPEGFVIGVLTMKGITKIVCERLRAG